MISEPNTRIGKTNLTHVSYACMTRGIKIGIKMEKNWPRLQCSFKKSLIFKYFVTLSLGYFIKKTLYLYSF